MSRTLLTIRQLCEKHPNFTEATIRWMLFKDVDDFENIIVRISRRIYIDEDLFWKFIDKNSDLLKKRYREKRNSKI